jgi:phage terminase large subunit GpA-like protein
MAQAKRIQVPPPRTPDEWADNHRSLPVGSAEPGRWRSSRTPYMIPIVRACTTPPHKRVIAVMASQMGKTAGLFNVIGQRLEDDPAPLIYVGPTRSNIDHVIEPKIMEMFKGVPSLWQSLQQGTQTKTHKKIHGVSLRFAWAGSATELASDSAVLVFVDEVDRMTESAQGEGNVFELAEARTSTYPDGRVIGTSTPTLGNVDTFVHPVTGLEHWAVSDTLASPIWRLWQEGSRFEWAWPCPDCASYFIPRLKQLWWPENANLEEIEQQAALTCPSCGVLISDNQKNQLNSRGVYLAPGQSVGAEGEVIGTADTAGTTTASFWVSGLCSFSAKKSFGYLARKLIAARQSGEFERLQSVMNTDFGELYSIGGEAPDWEAVAMRKQGYKQGEVPIGVEILTAGVDVQKNRLVYVVRGWGEHLESWLIDNGELWGETDKPDVWQRLSTLVHGNWQGHVLSQVAIDSGYQSQAVYRFCRLHKALAFPTKGHDHLDKPFKKSDLDVNTKGKTLSHSLSLWHFDSDYMKCGVHARITWPIDQPGGWWLPEDVHEDYCKQIVAEQRVISGSGVASWIRVKKDNHYLDCEALAYLVIRMMSAGREEGLGLPRKRVESRMIHPGFSIEGGEVTVRWPNGSERSEREHRHRGRSSIIHPGFDTEDVYSDW